MKTGARILTGIVAFMMLASGLVYMFVPDLSLGTTQITPDSLFGRANVRANMGGPMVTFGLFLCYAAFKANKQAIIPFLVFASLAILARLTGLALDGFESTAAFQVGFMVALLAATGAGYILFGKAEGVIEEMSKATG